MAVASFGDLHVFLPVIINTLKMTSAVALDFLGPSVF